jgi:potassium-transporting ATPase KdpC subunit
MMKQTVIGLRMLAVMTILTGVIYPLVVTGVAQIVFPYEANGSLITYDDIVVGSELIGQQTNDPAYFWWRPSAVNTMQGTTPEQLGSSGASNAGWTNAAFTDVVAERSAAFRSDNLLNDDTEIPADMVFASGSGLDPHISPEAAYLQVTRVADARGLDTQAVTQLVDTYVESPQLGFLGEPRVNVLLLNLALDELQ